MTKPHCCFIYDARGIVRERICDRDAEWEIKNAADSRDFTHACTEHVGALLGDADMYVVYPIPTEATP